MGEGEIKIKSLDSEEKVDETEKKSEDVLDSKSNNNSESESEDDLSIDFTEIKNKLGKLFKSSKSDERGTDKEITSKEKEEFEPISKPEDSEDDLGLDFSEVKNKLQNLFGSGKNKSSKGNSITESTSKEAVTKGSSSDSEDFDFDLSKAKTFFKSNTKWLIPLICILLVMSVSIWLRTMPLQMPVTDEWAETTVMNFYEGNIKNQINAQYPNLPEANKNSLVEQEMDNFLKQNSGQVNNDIKALSQQYKDKYRDDEGTLYLLGIDPWHFYRLTHYIVENGFPGTIIDEGGNIVDEYRLYPLGKNSYWDFHVWFGSALHKFLSFFSEVPLMFSFFLIGTIFSALSVIPAFFIGRRVTGNNVGGFFTSLLIAVSAFFVQRTTGESSDTDVYVVFFPLLITWLFLEAFEAKDLKKKLIWIVLAGISTGIFSFAWIGWWYVFDFVVATIGLYIIYQLLINYKNLYKFIKSNEFLNSIYILIGYILTSGLIVTIFYTFRRFLESVFGPFSFLKLKAVAVTSLWPNIMTTVAELNVAPLAQVVSQLGGKLLFALAIIGIILTIIKKDNTGKMDVKVAIFLVLWFLATLYATTKGVRFILQSIPVFSIALGAFLGITWYYASNWITKNLKLSRWISSIGVFLILSLLLIQPVQAGYAQAYGSVPSMNDEWYNTLTKIKNEAPENIVITSWWDFGYWFRTIANRPVTFDGGTQRGYDAHWVGKSLLTNDEKLTAGILRMLNCGQNSAFDELNEIVDDTVRSVDILNEIIIENKEDAIKILADYGLSSSQIASVTRYTHCDAPTDYYITSEDMVGKAGVWGHFGSWNFEKATMYQGVKKLEQSDAIEYLTTNFDLSEEEADQMYYEIQTTDADQWISPWPGYFSGLNGCSAGSNNTLTCNVGAQQGTFSFDIDLSTMNVTIGNNAEQVIYPNSVVYATAEGIEEKKFSENLAGVSLILVPNGDNYQVMVTDPLHAYSTFTKLFFFNGHGMKCFSKFDEVVQFTGGKVSTWIVDYDCQQENQVYFLPEEQVHAAHILITLDNRTEEEALELIESIKEDLTSENFAEYAINYSEGPSSVNGGDLGWFGKGVMIIEFENAAFALEEGEISEPILTQFGYHLIHVIEKEG